MSDKICTNCLKPSTMVCSRCKTSRYCSQKCQAENWKTHKLICSTKTIGLAPDSQLKVSSGEATNQKEDPNCAHDKTADTYQFIVHQAGLFSHTFVPDKQNNNNNLLILFHGYGDRHFLRLGTNLNLPQTCILSLQANKYCEWLESDHSLEMWRPKLLKLIDQVPFPKSRVFLLGFGEGAQVVIDLAIHYPTKLGGVVAISQTLNPSWQRTASTSKQKVTPFPEVKHPVPIFINLGEKQRDFTQEKELAGIVQKIFSASFKASEFFLKVYPRNDEILKTYEQGKDLVAFFASRLWLEDLGLKNHPDVIKIN